MAFPGCVIFLPPTAAAARFLFAAYDRWCAGREPSPAAAARRRDGSCCWGAELGHPLLTPQLSHGPSHTENGFSSDDIIVVAEVSHPGEGQCQATITQEGALM